MDSQIDEDTQVACLDLRDMSERPNDVTQFLQLATQRDDRFRAVVTRANGLIRPWNVVIVDSPEHLLTSHDFYQMFVQSPFPFRVIVLLVAENRDEEGSVADVGYLDLGFSNQQQLKFIVLSDLRGVEWSAGTHLPQAVSYWEKDPEGSLNIGVMMDALREFEVFQAVFAALQSQSSTAWAAGTRQIWMGKLSSDMTKDAFTEVAQDFTEGYPSHQEAAPPEPDPLLQGTAEVDQVLTAGSGLSGQLNSIKESTKGLHKIFGIETRRGVLRRIARSEALQLTQVRLHKETLRTIVETVTGLMETIDSTDGLDKTELEYLRNAGVNLQPVRARISGSALENDFIEQTVQFAQSAVGMNYSVAQIRDLLDQVSKKMKPRTREQSALDITTSIESTTSALSNVEAKEAAYPRGFRFRVGRRISRILVVKWPRYVFGFLYLWTLSAGIAELVSDSNSGVIPWPEPIRETLHLATVLLCIAFLLLGGLGGLAIMYADRRIKRWGLSFQFDELSGRAETMVRELARVAVNDWACFKIRDKTHRFMHALDEVLQVASTTVRDSFIDSFSTDQVEAELELSPNPEVRRDLNNKAKGKSFKFFDDNKQIISLDLSAMLSTVLSHHIFKLKTSAAGERVPGEVRDELSRELEKYVRDAKNFGLLYADMSVAESALMLRQDLAKRIWDDPGLVDDELQSVVLTRSPVRLVTFVHPKDIVILSADEEQSEEIRFVPVFASRRLLEVQNRTGVHPHVLQVDGMSAAGVIRVSPLRSVGASEQVAQSVSSD